MSLLMRELRSESSVFSSPNCAHVFVETTEIKYQRKTNGFSFYRVWGKPCFDISVSFLMLLTLSPLILLLMLIVVLDGGKPIFAHTRIGANGRRFKVLKIRTMRMNAESELAALLASDPLAAAEWASGHKVTNDPRITRIGAMLRRTSLDELPQLFNVLCGQMSLVGPRPVTEDELWRYGTAVSSYLSVKPGLTGPWQISGRNDLTYDERVALDVDYAAAPRLSRDVMTMLRTVVTVLRRTGR